MRRRRGEAWLAVLLAAVGILIGSLVGKAIEPHFPLAGLNLPIAWQPGQFNFGNVLKLAFGFQIDANVVGAAGAVAGILAWTRL